MDGAARERLLQLFRQTAADRVARISDALLALERGGGPPVREELQRELHTLKGEARLLGYAGLARVLHAAEDLLAAVAGGEGVEELLRVCDAVPGLLDGPPDGGDAARLLAGRLRSLAAPAPPAAGPVGDAGAGAPAGASSIRVDLERLDEIAALAGDLLVDGARARGRVRDLAALLDRWSRLADQATAVADRLRGAGAGPAADRIERDVHLLRSDTFRFLRRHADAVGAVQGQFGLLAERVGAARLIPLSVVMAGLPRAARDLAREQGKEVECTVAGGEVGVDRAILESLSDTLVHLLRNAVDHGIEPPAERERAGKPRAGRVAVTARLEGELLSLAVEDDGRGIDPEALRRAALRRGVAPEGQLAALEGRALLDLVFLPGFTTRPVAGEVSGRGLGLDVVRRRVMALGGSVSLESTPGAGTRIALRTPPSLALLKVLLVRVDDDVFGIPAADVEAVARIDPVDVVEVAGVRAVRRGGRLVPVAALGPLLALNGGPRGRRPAAAFLACGEEAAAVTVDGLAGEREVAVKRPGAFLQGMRFVAGAAALEDGRVALLLSTPDLVAAARRAGAHPPRARERRRLRVLLVDDSAIAREAEAALLRGLGHEVEEAADGEAAWRRLQEGAHQVLLTDVQMPVLDGIELTRRVKRAERFGRLPVVILSSLTAPEERRRGMDAGADAYLAKGDLDAEALAATLDRLCGAAR
jgi:two-component system chemotaxis sensor kinase CheA/two-component system sensor histidine kinase and response regulator WspE